MLDKFKKKIPDDILKPLLNDDKGDKDDHREIECFTLDETSTATSRKRLFRTALNTSHFIPILDPSVTKELMDATPRTGRITPLDFEIKKQPIPKGTFGKEGTTVLGQYDLVAHMYKQRILSKTSRSPLSVKINNLLMHKRLSEIETNPDNITPWLDMIMLVLDGAMRRGFPPVLIAGALHDRLQQTAFTGSKEQS